MFDDLINQIPIMKTIGIAALLIFLTVFIWVIVWTARAKKAWLDQMSRLPLEKSGDKNHV